MCWESSQGRANDGRGEAGRKQADGFCQGRTLALPSQLSELSLRERLGLKGVTDGQDEEGSTSGRVRRTEA